MKLPIIRQLSNFIEKNDEDYIHETIEVLEDLTEVSSLKEDELNVIGELLSNLYGSLEVVKAMREEGISQRESIKKFMDRVLGSIDT